MVSPAKPRKDLSFHSIMHAVCLACGVSQTALVAKSRRHAVCDARHILFWLARRYTGQSLVWIGQHVGGRDHTTVLHGVEKVEANMADFKDRIDMALSELGIVG